MSDDEATANNESRTAVGAPVEPSVRPPMRALRLTLKLEADNRAEMAWALHNMADQIKREELTVGVSGGPYSGAIYELLHDPAQTHEQYFRDVQAYLADKKAAA